MRSEEESPKKAAGHYPTLLRVRSGRSKTTIHQRLGSMLPLVMTAAVLQQTVSLEDTTATPDMPYVVSLRIFARERSIRLKSA